MHNWLEPIASAKLGLYRVHWASGGTSLAAIGMNRDGSRWIAPTNWISPAASSADDGWAAVNCIEAIRLQIDEHNDEDGDNA